MQPQTAHVGSITVQVPGDKCILVCQICKSHLGLFDPEKIHLPVTHDQFESIDPFHGMLPPFPYVPGRPDSLEHKTMKCPICHLYPFIKEDMLLTPEGYFEVGKDRLVPRKRTPEDDRQEIIEKEWQEQEAAFKASMGSISEANQREIDRIWAEEEVKEAEIATVDRILDDVAGRNRFFKKRKRGRPKKS